VDESTVLSDGRKAGAGDGMRLPVTACQTLVGCRRNAEPGPITGCVDLKVGRRYCTWRVPVKEGVCHPLRRVQSANFYLQNRELSCDLQRVEQNPSFPNHTHLASTQFDDAPRRWPRQNPEGLHIKMSFSPRCTGDSPRPAPSCSASRTCMQFCWGGGIPVSTSARNETRHHCCAF